MLRTVFLTMIFVGLLAFIGTAIGFVIAVLKQGYEESFTPKHRRRDWK